MPPAEDFTGQTIAGRLVLGRAGRHPHNRSPLWLARCLTCGREAALTRYFLAKPCKRCANRARAKATSGKTPASLAHIASLHTRVWSRRCLTCGAEFVGTARQQYCRPEHRPSYQPPRRSD